MQKLSQVIYLLLFSIISIVFVTNYHKIPTRLQHANRNKRNIIPLGKLRLISNNGDEYYLDVNNIKWKKRTFIRNLLHNPFKNYTFETYYPNVIYSSESTITISDFDKGIMKFKPQSFNYYSSYYHPLSHIFADILPIILHINTDYKKF